METAVDGFSADVARRIVGISYRRLDYWDKTGRTYVAVLTPDLAAGGYTIEVPELPGLITEADTVQQARRMAADAIRLRLSVSESTKKRRAR